MYINTIIHNTTKMKIFFVHVCSQVIHLNPFSSRYQISQNSIFKTKSQSFVVISPITSSDKSRMSLLPNLSTKDLFLKFCEEGKLSLVKALLAEGADVNWQQEGGSRCSALHFAATDGNGRLLDILMAQPELDVNIKAVYSLTPVMWACQYGNANIVRRLLLFADLNNRDDYGGTALHYAVLYNFPDCVELLAGAGADWNVMNNGGHSPFTLAARLGFSGILKFALSLFCDLTLQDGKGKSVAWLALENMTGPYTVVDALKCVQLLSQDSRVDWNTRNQAGDTPLMSCLKNNKLEVAKMILNNARVHFCMADSNGKFPETIARLILKHIPNISYFFVLQREEPDRDPGPHEESRILPRENVRLSGMSHV